MSITEKRTQHKVEELQIMKTKCAAEKEAENRTACVERAAQLRETISLHVKYDWTSEAVELKEEVKTTIREGYPRVQIA